MNIAIDIRTIGRKRTGSETVIVELTKRLLSTYHGDTYFLLTDTTDPQVHAYIRAALSIHDHKNVHIYVPTQKRLVWLLWGVSRLSKKIKADIFLTENIVPFFIPRSTSVVTYIHDVSFKAARHLLARKDLYILDLLMPRSLRRADGIIAVSTFTKKEIIQYYPGVGDKVLLVPNACADIFREEATPDDLRRVQEKYRLPQEYIFALGTMQPRKNIPLVIEAFVRISERLPNTSLVLSGERGHHFDATIDTLLAGHPELVSRIIFTGYITPADLPLVFRNAHVFIYPSLYEGFGIPILEAFWVDVPVVASRTDVHIEVAGNGAAYFTPTRIDECSETLYDMCTDENMRNELLTHAQRQRELFSWKQSVERLYGVFTSLRNETFQPKNNSMYKRKSRAASPNTSKKRKWIIGSIIFLVLLIAVGVWKAESITNSITTKGSLIGSLAKSLPGSENMLEGEEDGRINIVLLGMRGKGVEGGGQLTDTIIVASIIREGEGDDAKWNYALTSIPRDLLVTSPSGGTSKVNAVYAFAEEKGTGEGLEQIKQMVATISGQPIHYAVMINFAGFENIVDILGGIDVDLSSPFSEPVQFNETHVCDGDNGGVFTIPTGEFEYKYGQNDKIAAQYPLCGNKAPECGGTFNVPAGKSTLNGEQALCYTRSRATSSDFDRARRQQEVLAQMRVKATSVGLLTDFDRINNILGTLGENIQIDLEPWEVKEFFDFYKNLGENTSTKVLENSPEGLLEAPGVDATYGYVLLPRGGSYDQIHELFRSLQ